jgi:hypothetical protein
MRDYILEPNSFAASQTFTIAPTVAASTTRVTAAIPIHTMSLVDGVDLWCRDVTNSVAINGWVSRDSCVLGSVGLAIDSAAEKFQTGAFVARVGATVFQRAAATALTFTAAHVVSADKFGAIRIQMAANGTISTKVVASPQAYDSAYEALQNLPNPDAGNIAIGYILIEADNSTWTANTDDMTNGSDLVAATFVSAGSGVNPEGKVTSYRIFDGSSPTYVDGQLVEASLNPVVQQRYCEPGTLIVLTSTGDSGAALADGQVYLRVRAFPLKGEVITS